MAHWSVKFIIYRNIHNRFDPLYQQPSMSKMHGLFRLSRLRVISSRVATTAAPLSTTASNGPPKLYAKDLDKIKLAGEYLHQVKYVGRQVKRINFPYLISCPPPNYLLLLVKLYELILYCNCWF